MLKTRQRLWFNIIVIKDKSKFDVIHQFTSIGKVKEAFDLTIREGVRFFPEIAPIQPTSVLEALLANSVPWAIAVST